MKTPSKPTRSQGAVGRDARVAGPALSTWRHHIYADVDRARPEHVHLEKLLGVKHGDLRESITLHTTCLYSRRRPTYSARHVIYSLSSSRSPDDVHCAYGYLERLETRVFGTSLTNDGYVCFFFCFAHGLALVEAHKKADRRTQEELSVRVSYSLEKHLHCRGGAPRRCHGGLDLSHRI